MRAILKIGRAGFSVNIYICTSMYVRMNGDLACVLTSGTVKQYCALLHKNKNMA